ncbi:hypothetical protein CDV36_007615 [Fusarium kuroshium]|uniref:FAD/NAD(P)-binding domain-containing protein n=2 Tax=Fusarium solani species complex TaxID=232080 RepID=A0A3M2S581_9HYPO|nr:hypothetical protein CDV36_007615 [Fusarium kuroshium]
MEDITVAIVGTGKSNACPAGLTALKSLREEGFDAVAFERREAVGGLWAYSDDPEYTSALDDTTANISKFVSGFSDFPIPKESPPYLSRRQIHGYFESYAKHFELHKHISFGTTVKKVLRNESQEKWDIYITGPDGDKILSFDKVVFGNGCESVPVWPSMPGRDMFTGTILHSQAFRSDKIDEYKGKRVLVVGIGNTGCEVALSLCKHASKTYQAYRRGRIVASRYGDDGVPTDSLIPWPILRLKYLLDYWAPWLTNPLVDKFMVDKMINDAARHEPVSPGTSKKEKLRLAGEKVRGEWRLVPCPSLAHKHPALQENFFPALYNQEIIPVHGFVDFVGEKKVILGDGQIVEVDVVIFATGYKHDFSLMPELEMDGAVGFPLTTPGEVDDRKEPSLPRLFQMIFPPKWASSVAFLSWMAPQENVWCVCELASMAVTQAWAADISRKKDLKAPVGYRPASLLPSKEEMDKEVDSYHAWWRKQWTVDHSVLPGYVRAHSFYRFLHSMAGTGLYEHLDHVFTTRGWWLWWNDYELWKWLAKGPMNSYSWRLFDTNPLQMPGRGRKVWAGARKAVEEAYHIFEDFKAKQGKVD